ncbi:MAG: hypothetical protein KGI40_09275 [Xanthomonadaceae bacterium]|nr:hypothetical protein [Xanthomonadaceae bacterium]MDE2246520.1 hypothetical protein [Xanthomonadaceae bacterium]
MPSSTIRRIFAAAAILLLGCSLSSCFYPGYGYPGGDHRRGDDHSERDHRGDGGDNRDGGGNPDGGGSHHRQGDGN